MMQEEIIEKNAKVINQEITWLDGLLKKRLNVLNGKATEAVYFSKETLPHLNDIPSPYSDLINQYKLGAAERLLLICALAPHISPETFTDQLRDEGGHNLSIKYPKMGGYFDPTFTNFVPTLQTVLHLLGGEDMSTMLYYHLFLTGGGTLIREQIITLRNVYNGHDDTNMRNHAIALAPEYVDYLISGKKPRPDFGRNFPATHITTALEWSDLVVPLGTKTELERIMRWEKNGKTLITNTGNRLNGSFTCLFYGPSGSGKTLAVQLLGKNLGVDVFRIDLSMVVSKYVGETEKNLAYLFDRAKNKNWILFFDEADALFGKRTEIHDSKDKWANLEMSYLLQRMEEHNGLTVLATNLKNNIDQAMSRRFQSVLYFARPDKEQRLELWKKLMPSPYFYHPGVDFEKLAHYELTGGNIINVIKAACLDAEAANHKQVDSEDIIQAIKREFNKENRVPN